MTTHDDHDTMRAAGSQEHWHRRIFEGRGALFAVVTTIAISIGGLAEIVPLITMHGESEAVSKLQPYTPLEVAGRDIYVREGCYTCHSQMVRPFRSETLRYGTWSRSEEYAFDKPFQLGSRRMGPDLHRVGKKYGDSWHYNHMMKPSSMTDGSVMPPFPWLAQYKIDPADIQASMWAQKIGGTPYTDEDIQNAPAALREQGQGIVERLAADQITAEPDDEIVALIAYLQSLGRYKRADVAGDGAGAGVPQ
jgi:cytochrome c oxidase cbb3-type subunit I/II